MRNRIVFPLLIAFTLLCSLASASAQKANKQEKEQQKQKVEEQSNDVISVDTNLVVLNVTITDAKERYVAGLKKENFSVFEDTVQQRITGFSFEETPFAAVLLLDTRTQFLGGVAPDGDKTGAKEIDASGLAVCKALGLTPEEFAKSSKPAA